MPTLAMLYPPVNFWLALLSLSTKFRSQLKPPPQCSSPFNPVLKYQVSNVTRRFDFDGPSNFTAPGFIGVRATTLYSGGLGYGWNAGVLDFERSGPTPLRRDGHYGGQGAVGTFAFQVAAGVTYHLRVYVGDNDFLRDQIALDSLQNFRPHIRQNEKSAWGGHDGLGSLRLQTRSSMPQDTG